MLILELTLNLNGETITAEIKESPKVYKCSCGTPLIGKAEYCFKCGKKQDWENNYGNK